MPSNSPAKVIASEIGRRKAAVASVRLLSGNGKITVNDRPAHEYFPGTSSGVRLALPFKVIASAKYDATVRISGGGKSSQLDALLLGLSRALAAHNSGHKAPLRAAGLLTRDYRSRQRRMVGTGGKARRRKQSPKR